MRTVSLSNSIVQEKIAKSFIPLKVQIDYGSSKFPLDWPALENWRNIYAWMGGSKTKGITACCVVSPNLQITLGSTGSAMVWELFDSIAYDPIKFANMLDNSLERFQIDQQIHSDQTLSNWQRTQKLARHHASINRAVSKEGKFHLPPKGFTINGAKTLFRLSGDFKDGNP